MGLSSKQVTSDVIDWSQALLQGQVLEPPKPVVLRRQQQQNHQQPEPLKCPRCDSTNTKFCYYNNYNKSQPRHFCKACKRHWTKGGTLRNVPVGGGRKNKRPKTSKPTTNSNTNVTDKATTSSTSTTTTSTTNMIMNGVNSHMTVEAQQQKQNLSMATLGYQAMIGALPTSGFQQNCTGNSTFNGTNNNSVFLGSSFSHQGINFNFQSLSSSCFDVNPCSTSVQSSGFCDYMSSEAMEDSTITTIFPTSTSSVLDHNQQEWQVPNGIDMTSYWNWDNMESLVSSTDLNIAWDGSEIKP